MRRSVILSVGLFVTVVLAIIFCGRVVSGREFESVVPHVVQDAAADAVPSAGNYSELKKQIIALVENAQTQGVIRLYDYTEDVEADLPRACHEVMTQIPVGVYAVDTMSLDHTRVLSYYDVRVSISYKRPKDEILAMVSAGSAEEFKQAVLDSLENNRSTFSVLCNYYTEKIIDVAEIMENLRLNQPETMYGIEDVRVEFFPEEGLHKVLLVELSYYETAQDSKLKRKQAQDILTSIVDRVGSLKGKARLSQLCTLIGGNAKYVSDGGRNADVPYGVLVQKRASDMGFACALKQACNLLGEYSVVVKGEYNGRLHYWNMVLADNAWRHVDLSRGVLFAEDSDMHGYKWDDLRYPTDMRYLRD